MCRVLLMPDSLSLVWGHSVYLQNFCFHDFRNSTPSTVFIWFELKFIQSILIGANIGCYFLTICQRGKILWHFDIFVNTAIWGWKFQNATPPTVFTSYQPNFMRTLGYYGAIQAITFLANPPSFKNLCHFEILTWESMGNLKYGVSRKRLIVEQKGRKFGIRGPVVHIWKVLLMPDCFSLVWGYLVRYHTIFKNSAPLPILSDSSKLYTRYHNHTGCRFFGHLPKIAKNSANWNIS